MSRFIKRLKFLQRAGPKILKIGGPRMLFLFIVGAWLKKTYIMPDPNEIFASPFWFRVPGTDYRVYNEVFIDCEYALTLDSEPEAIVDAGANIGLSTIYLANRFPHAKVIALEPEGENFELLCRNVKPYSNVVPVRAALWDKNEDLRLFDPGRGSWGFRVDAYQETSSIDSIPGMTVDTLMSDFGLERIDILKIDIEGAEKEVFKDTSPWLSKVETLIIELHERIKPGTNRSFYNGSNGFQYERQRGEKLYLSRHHAILEGSP